VRHNEARHTVPASWILQLKLPQFSIYIVSNCFLTTQCKILQRIHSSSQQRDLVRKTVVVCSVLHSPLSTQTSSKFDRTSQYCCMRRQSCLKWRFYSSWHARMCSVFMGRGEYHYGITDLVPGIQVSQPCWSSASFSDHARNFLISALIQSISHADFVMPVMCKTCLCFRFQVNL